jgi:hypothetical protein
MGQISSFLLAKVGDEGEAHANFSTVEGGPSKIRVDYGYGINDGSEDALNTYVQGVSIFNSGNGGYPTGFKQFIAIAVGESGGNFNEIETKAIASSMINRINQASTSLNDPNWLKKISYGGNTKTNFVAIAGNNVDYNAVMGMSLNKITNSSNKYIKAAISAYDNWEVDYSNPKGFPDTGLYYWNASKGMAGSSYGKNPDNYIITLTAGGTTFYRPK